MSLPTPVFLTTQSTPVTRAASHGCFGEGANYVAGLIPHGFFHEDEGPCSHVPPARPAWLHRHWRHVRTHTRDLQHRLGPSGKEAQGSHSLSVRYRQVNRSPGVATKEHGDGLRRCGGRGNV